MKTHNSVHSQMWRGLLASTVLLILFASCARMGNPDGGWYDEEPPRIIGCQPEDKATNVKTQRMAIYFNEYIKIDNPTENVVVSPPQMEMRGQNYASSTV